VFALGGFENRLRVLLDAGSVSAFDTRLQCVLQRFDISTDQPARVKFGEHPVSVPDGIAARDRDRALIIEAQPDECEHI